MTGFTKAAINYELESSADNHNKGILGLRWNLKVSELTTSKPPVSLVYITSWGGFHSPSFCNLSNQVLKQKKIDLVFIFWRMETRLQEASFEWITFLIDSLPPWILVDSTIRLIVWNLVQDGRRRKELALNDTQSFTNTYK